MTVFSPQPGPQSIFLSCEYDIALYGGAAGSGKSYALMLEGARWSHVGKFSGVFFRRTQTDLRKPGGPMQKARVMYQQLGARLRDGSHLDAVWPSGARLAFRGIEAESDVHQWQGTELDLALFDELGHFTAYQFWYIMSRLRSTSGIKPYIRASCNPEPAPHWMRELVDWWIDPATGFAIPERSGAPRWIVRQDDAILFFASETEARAHLADVGDTDARPLSMTFISASLDDNPALLAEDPNYRGNLAVQDRVTRAKLLESNWNATPEGSGMLRPEWFKVVEAPSEHVHQWARGWDRAARPTSEVNRDPDWTRGAKVGVQMNGRAIIADMVSKRGLVGEVLELIVRTAKADGPHVTQCFSLDPGSAGLAEEKQLRDALSAVVGCGPVKTYPARRPTDMQSRNDGRSVKEVLAARWATFADTGPGFDLVRGVWNGALFAEMAKFPTKGVHDDQVDAISCAWNHLIAYTPRGNLFLKV